MKTAYACTQSISADRHVLVIPRVTAALAQFIAPISSARAQTGVDDRNREQEARQRPDQERQSPKQGQPEPHLKLVPPPTPVEAEVPDEPIPLAPLSTDPRVIAAPGTPSVASAFLELFTKIQIKRISLVRWLGQQAYDRAVRRQKRVGTFRKGTMIDRRVD